jgi:hypothetical protein
MFGLIQLAVRTRVGLQSICTLEALNEREGNLRKKWKTGARLTQKLSIIQALFSAGATSCKRPYRPSGD